MRIASLSFIASVLLLCCLLPGKADVKLPVLICEHMVLQRDIPVHIWGWADEGENVTVIFRGQKVATVAQEGKWQVVLQPLKFGGPFGMSIQGKNTITFSDVLVGDVWISTGQSNMMMMLSMIDLTTIPVISPELTSTQTGNYNLVLDDNGKLTGTLDIQFAGNIGWMLRSSIKRVPVANHEMVLRVLTSRLVPDAVYESGNFEALEEIDIPLVIHLKFHADNYSTKLENFLSIPTPWLVKRDEQSAIFEDPKRKQDLEIGPAYGQQRYNCTITLPTGYTPIDMPALSEQTCPSFSYRLTYQVENNTLHGEISSTFSSLRIPITEYAAFSDVMKKFYNAAEKKLIFKK